MCRGRRVVVFVDSTGCVSGLLTGSKTPSIQAVLERIFDLCIELGIDLVPLWLPREHELLRLSDGLGKVKDDVDFRLAPWAVERLQRLSPFSRPLDFDAMASSKLRHFPAFFSRFFSRFSRLSMHCILCPGSYFSGWERMTMPLLARGKKGRKVCSEMDRA